jgi:hypothetical protein
MKPCKPILLLIPSLLIEDLETYLKTIPNSNKYRRIYFYYVIHYITVKHIRNKDEDFVSINKEKLKSITVSNISRYITILKQGKFILTDNEYREGGKSYCYKLNPSYCENFTKVEITPRTRIFNKIIKTQYNTRTHNNRLEPFLRTMNDFFKAIDINYTEAENWIQDNAEVQKKHIYLTSLMHIKDKRFRYFNRNKTNTRLDTNLTNLKKEIRQFIIGNYVCIDLKNSQPFFLSQLIKTIIQQDKDNIPLCSHLYYSDLIKTFGIKAFKRVSLVRQNEEKTNLANLKQFENSVLKGSLYDDFVDLYKGKLIRDEVKKIVIKVLFSRNIISKKYSFIPYKADKEIFATIYPFIYDVIKILKEKNHAALAICLQRIESYIFIDCIAKELVNNGIVPITIHDSVIIHAGNQEKALEIMSGIFKQKFNVVPSFHVELLKPKLN